MNNHFNNEYTYGLSVDTVNEPILKMVKILNNNVIDSKNIEFGDNIVNYDDLGKINIYHAKTNDTYNLEDCHLRKYEDRNIICLQSVSKFSEHYIITHGIINIF